MTDFRETQQPTDEQYEAAIKLAVAEKHVSISLIQRRLGFGYTRSSMIIERMDGEGLLGAPFDQHPNMRHFVGECHG